MELRVEPESSSDGRCDCCGDATRTVSGFVSTRDTTIAAYFVSWTLGAIASHGANIDFIIGSWGEGSSPADRTAVALEFHVVDGQPQFTVCDARARPAGSSDLVSQSLRRAEVLDTPLAQQVFNLTDAVWLQDPRLAELSAA